MCNDDMEDMDIGEKDPEKNALYAAPYSTSGV
jgi:hypothetical protein